MPSMRAGLRKRRGRWRSQLLAHFGRKARHGGIIEIGGNADRLVALRSRGDVLVLAPHIGGVAGIDLELGRNRRLEPADLRPDAREPREIDRGIAPAGRRPSGAARPD